MEPSPSDSAPSRVAVGDGEELRILDVTTFYSPTSGGVRTYLHAKIRDFDRRGLSHALLVPGPADETTMVGQARMHHVKSPTIPFTPDYRFLLSTARLEEVFMSERPHVVEVGSPLLLPLMTRWAMRSAPVPTVGFFHSDLVRTYIDPYVRSLPGPLQEKIRRGVRAHVLSVYNSFDVTVAASNTVVAELRDLGVRNVRRVPLGVDLSLFRPQEPCDRWKAEIGADPGVPIALFVGRLCAEKRIDVVLDAHRLMEPGTRPHLVFVGNGTHYSSLRAEAAARGRMTVLPYLADSGRLARLYSTADYYLAAGPGETFGLAVAEALACGLPVVGVDSGAVPDRVDGSEASVLFRHEDPESCARAMRAMASILSPALRSRARLHAENTLGWRQTFDALHDIYAELALSRLGARA